MEVVVIEKDDAGYPVLLKEVVGAPERLFVKGNREILGKPMVAVVGSRKMSDEGERKTKLVVEELVQEGYVIVSGLAKGVDGVVHRTVIEKGGETVAVMAHGLDMVYPAEHTDLAKEIVQNGGVLVSELKVGTRPERGYFLERNRIIVGMSRALIVVEAELRSGSLASANHAAEMGRTVLAVAGSKGTDLLISEGCEVLDVV